MKKTSLSPQKIPLHLLLAAGMVLLNFTMPLREPLSFPLFFAALSVGLHPIISGMVYLAASMVRFSLFASLSALCQAVFLSLLFFLYEKKGSKPRAERIVYLLLAQLPFIFLYPHEGYALPLAPVLQKTALAALFLLLSFFFEGGLRSLLSSPLKCRLRPLPLAEISLMWCAAGIGMGNAFGEETLTALSVFLLLFAVILSKNSASVPLALLLSVPLCVCKQSLAPFSELGMGACFALLLSPYGRGAAGIGYLLVFLAFRLFTGIPDQPLPIVLSLLSGVLPVLVAVCLPDKVYRRAEKSLLFYREKNLSRAVVNRNRRFIAERLYDVSALFREIEQAFLPPKLKNEAPVRVRECLCASVCSSCEYRELCQREKVLPAIDKLIAVGLAKGSVNLIDLPSDLTEKCHNTAGLLFVLNQHLSEYTRFAREMDASLAERKLLAEEARGVSEILKNLALSESEEISFSERERELLRALEQEGVLCRELFLFGEGERFSLTATVVGEASAKKLGEIFSEKLSMPLILSEKIPLESDVFCFIFHRKPRMDAAFGVSSRAKDGESASGDTHSVLKIDERRFLVALSDGMGSGESAHEISENTLSLIESCYKAGMPAENVLSTVNKLVSYSSDEQFVCLDVAAVNLDTGEVDVVKIGSPAGFVMTATKLHVLEGGSLPMGMLETLHPATMHATLSEDDFLIFMSDGISDAFGSPTELISYLNSLHPVNPQALSDEILQKALSLRGGKAEDDMTVLTVRMLAG